MATNTFPDGFPIAAKDAINFSYFLSDAEKAEWMEWLKTANEEQQNELVETLHAIWEENQKEVVPDGFDNKKNVIDAEVVSSNNQNSSTPSSLQPPSPGNGFIGATEEIKPKNEIPVTNQPTSLQDNSSNLQKQSAQVNVSQNSQTPKTITASAENNKPISQAVPNQDTTPNVEINRDVSSHKQEELKKDFVFNEHLDNQQIKPAQPQLTKIESEKKEDFNQTEQSKDIKPDKNEFEFVEKSSVTQESKPISNPNPNSNYSNNSQQTNNLDPRKFESKNRKDNEKPNSQISQNNNQRQNENKGNFKNERVNNYPQNNQSQQNRRQESKANINFGQVKETSTEKELRELSKIYEDSMQRLTQFEQETITKRTQLSVQLASDLKNLVSKMSGILSVFENVSEYLEDMTAKLLKMNDVVVKQSEENQKFRSSIESKVVTLNESVDFVQSDVDRLYREIRTNKDENRSQIQDLRSQLSSMGAGVYSPTEVFEKKLDLMNSKIIGIENKLGALDDPKQIENRPKYELNKQKIQQKSIVKNQDESNFSDQKKTESKDNKKIISNSTKNNSVIDLRNVV
ncbi:hypothetical protein HC766_04230 [Candidatus Gracilibacteria bacterium]|nr:hypothetical protein [Candidatus Gracilibacteria bacterium]NJS41533.1 hypothetical protein [Candidatus Gracilibacteria bacterium]